MKPEFELNFSLANAAFEGEERQGEIARILKGIAAAVDRGDAFGPIFDVNGNRVGSWGFDAAPAVEDCPDCGEPRVLDETHECEPAR